MRKTFIGNNKSTHGSHPRGRRFESCIAHFLFRTQTFIYSTLLYPHQFVIPCAEADFLAVCQLGGGIDCGK